MNTCYDELFKLTYIEILISGVNDVFMGQFLFQINLVFCMFTHLSRYWLGGIHEAYEFSILSGIKVRAFYSST